tara:strand:+ start:710 stop:1489 length:780 start_codon:yes stop_codon:yes gene_type:complete
MIIDSHCHLDFDSLNNKLDNVVKNANNVGVKYLLTICTNNESFKIIRNILDKYKNIYGTYGIHPHETKNYSNLTVDDIKINLIKNKKIIGIGESGLDFYYNHSEPDIQKKCFLNHIKASQETSKTLIVHSRNAEKETLNLLTSEIKNKKFKILMHCFTGSKEFAHKLLDIGCYFSASGIITFKKNKDLTDTFKSIPNERILVETDSPYLSPEPLRGKTNEPKNIVYTIKCLSKIKNVTEDTVSKFTSKNFFHLFNINQH